MQDSHTPGSQLLRLLDAAANRTAEGLRVVEDYARFVLDDAHLTAAWKQLRHDLTAALLRLPAEWRAASRQTSDDVGTRVSTPSERARAGLTDVVAANLARSQQGLRTLEEYGKLLPFAEGPSLGSALEAIRYRCYTLAAATELRLSSLSRLEGVRLMVLVDAQASPRAFADLVESVLAAGAGAIQLRDKNTSDRNLRARAGALAEMCRQAKRLAIINDRPDIAAAARADGVQLGQDDLSVKDVREIVGPRRLIGVSTHSLEQARAAVLAGAHYIGVGPTYPSRTKSFDHFPGPALLKEVAAEMRLPAFAIGGITADNVAEVVACGFDRVAVGTAVTGASDPAAAVVELTRRLEVKPCTAVQ